MTQGRGVLEENSKVSCDYSGFHSHKEFRLLGPFQSKGPREPGTVGLLSICADGSSEDM